jgi:hypothetical protein
MALRKITGSTKGGSAFVTTQPQNFESIGCFIRSILESIHKKQRWV